MNLQTVFVVATLTFCAFFPNVSKILQNQKFVFLAGHVTDATNTYFVCVCVCVYGISRQVVLSKSLKDTSSRLAELGWLHNKVRKYTDARSLDRAFGLVGQVRL